MKKKTKFIILVVLIIIIIAIIGSFFLRYHVKPSETNLVNNENLVEDGSFENFNQSLLDCCTTPKKAKEAIIFASKSQDSFNGKFSLNLTSYNHCACINKPILNFSNFYTYLLSFYYKGDNPRICNLVTGDEECMPNKKIENSTNWTYIGIILNFTDNSESSSIFLYSDSTGSPVTNLYDDLQVHKLTPISNSGPFNPTEQYIIKTNPDNLVQNGEKLNDQGFYLITGTPNITLKFPWTELVILIIILLIVIRLLFTKQAKDIEEEISHDIRRDIQRTIKLYGK